MFVALVAVAAVAAAYFALDWMAHQSKQFDSNFDDPHAVRMAGKYNGMA